MASFRQLLAMEPLIVANTKFSIDLLKVMLKASTGNVLFSPLSISSALGLVLLGAKGNTADQMYKGLRFNNEKIMYHDLYEVLNGEDKRSLTLFNRMFGERTIDFSDDFLDKCDEWCFASLRVIDFRKNPDDARKRINTWVEKKTKEKFKNVLDQKDVRMDTSLVLISAVHFKNEWAKAFSRVSPELPLMKVTDKFPLGAIPEADSRILEIPFENKDLSMLVMLPNKSDGLQKLVDTITYEKILEWTEPDRIIPTDVTVIFPIFQLEESYDLENFLEALGITDLFNEKCDLSGMAPGALKLGKVVHKSCVEVDEKRVDMEGDSVDVVDFCVKNQERFEADKPFLFFIRHNPTKTILFWSRVIPNVIPMN